jgi:hypothetical protein
MMRWGTTVIEGTPLCQSCQQRSAAGEFRAGRKRMTEGLEKTGVHTSEAKAATDYTYFTCRDCGQGWMLTEDSSAARYLSRRRIA